MMMYMKTYNVWKPTNSFGTASVHEQFAWDIKSGNKGSDEQDLESEQSHTFTVRASENADSVLASSPVLHSNGTLEFELKVNRSGYANFSIVLTDDVKT